MSCSGQIKNRFAEYHPIDPGDDEEALARNRRIELKLTER